MIIQAVTNECNTAFPDRSYDNTGKKYRKNVGVHFTSGGKTVYCYQHADHHGGEPFKADEWKEFEGFWQSWVPTRLYIINDRGQPLGPPPIDVTALESKVFLLDVRVKHLEAEIKRLEALINRDASQSIVASAPTQEDMS